MKDFAFRLAPLGAEHDRDSFCCGEEALDRYFKTQATQDIRRRIANCFVAVEAATGRVAAYYTIAAASIPLLNLPPEEAKRLPRYPTLPAVRIGRLAVDQRFQGRGLGGALLVDAGHRSSQSPPAVYTLLVDAKNDQAVAFYQRFGFRTLASQPRTLFLPLATLERTFPSARGSALSDGTAISTRRELSRPFRGLLLQQGSRFGLDLGRRLWRILLLVYI
jgi:GNAT superfamily N-acetyltransferase